MKTDKRKVKHGRNVMFEDRNGINSTFLVIDDEKLKLILRLIILKKNWK